MPIMVFISAVLALLLAPGPTNTLMGLAGAQRGLPRVIGLLPAELAGYLTTILPLSFLGAQLVADFPAFAIVLKIVAAGWIMVLAVRLWGAGAGDENGRDISARRVYVTTALNPKALIFALVLLPPPQDADFALRLGLFCAMVVGVALVWGALGMLTQMAAGGETRLRILQRLASGWLVFVSLSLVFSLMKV